MDWNGDGFTDYVTVDHEGYLAYYQAFLKNGEKWLKPGRRIFKNDKGVAIRISELAGGQSRRARIIMVDWDGDGDLDILHNAHYLFGKTQALLKRVKNAGWYENVGCAGQAVFTWRGELIKREIAISSEHSSGILVKQARLRFCSCIGSDENSGFKVLTKNNGKDMPCVILKNI